MPCIIGVDIGTTHCKAIRCDEAGKVLHTAKRAYATDHPQPGFHVQDADEIYTATKEVIKEVTAGCSDIVAMAFSAAMHSILAIDSTGTPLTAAITWADLRSSAYAKKLLGTDNGTRIYQATGTPIHPMSPLCKIPWIRDNWPAVFQSARHFVSIKEYVLFRLTGELVVDYSTASSSGMFDLQNKSWHPESLSFAGIQVNNLSSPVPPDYRYRSLRAEAAEELNLEHDIAVYAGGSDGCLANIGTGALGSQEPALTIGTSGAIRRLVTSSQVDPAGTLFTYRFDEELFLNGGAINNGGNLLQWFVDLFVPGQTDFQKVISELMDEAASVPFGADSLIFLPYIHGERAPVWDAAATGVFAGIKASHGRAHFFHALLEGVAFSLRSILDALEVAGDPVSSIRASGGFLESRLWVQIMADILNKPLLISDAADSSAMGAVFVAMKARGTINNFQDLKHLTTVHETVNPEPGLQGIVDRNYQIFKGLYKPA